MLLALLRKIDKPKLGSVATNRFVYRKLLGGLGGSYPVPFPSSLDFGFRGFSSLWSFPN